MEKENQGLITIINLQAETIASYKNYHFFADKLNTVTDKLNKIESALQKIEKYMGKSEIIENK